MRPMENRKWRWAKQAALWVLAGSLAACGDVSVRSPTDPNQNPEPQRRLLTEGIENLGNPGSTGSEAFVEFTLNAAGTLEIEVDWIDPANNINVAVIHGHCGKAMCENPFIFEGTPAKPKVIQDHVQSGLYTLMLLNNGPGADRCMYQIFLAS